MSAVVVMSGFEILGILVSASSNPKEFGAHSAALLSGKLDYQIKAAAHYRLTGEIFQKDEQLEKPENLLFLEKTKQLVRDFIIGLFQEETNDLQKEHQQALESLKNKLRKSNKPHTQGTVSELATKLGVSKSEVRRMKTEGTLDEALSKLEN